MSAVLEAPKWDMAVVFPSLESREFKAEFDAVISEIGDLEQFFDKNEVASGNPFAKAFPDRFDEVVRKWNSFHERMRPLNAYVYSFVTTDSRNALALAKQSELQIQQARIRDLATRLTAWTGRQPIDQLLASSSEAKEHEYAVRKAQEESRHLMSAAEEALSSQMALTGSVAWGKLHGNISSQIEFPLEVKGRTEVLPMSAVRNLAYEGERQVRKAAYEAELASWKQNEVSLAASLNGVKGEVATLSAKRGWQSPLDEALFRANIDRQTLDAMMAAAREAFPEFRKYLQAKARALDPGAKDLPWYDLFAPYGGEGRTWRFDEAADFVTEQFSTYSKKMGDFAARTFRERWTDASPSPGKRDGAFCMGLRKDESRILMNFKPAFGSVSTLAHELGHAYHNLCLAERTHIQRMTPMTLAETASIFCETIVRQAGLKQGTEQEQVAILEASLQGSCQTVVDITSRFLFESAVFEKRKQRELSADEFCEVMLDAQEQTYGDGLDPNKRHPYMWAVKPHYYSSHSFYNFPYMFGLLFALGLYKRFQQDPDSFRAGYDQLLSSTGLSEAADLGLKFDIDIHDIGFWRGSLDTIRGDIKRFVDLVDGVKAN